MKGKKVLWITKTAVFLALLIVLQAGSRMFGQLVTGSLVNLTLIICVMTCGMSSGAVIALCSPVLAKLIGIGPLWTIIPFVMFANLVLIMIWRFVGMIKIANKHIVRLFTLIIAAACKFTALYAGVVKLALPLFLDLQPKQEAVISAMFSLNQLFTALIGGAAATVILPVLEKSILRNEKE